MFGFARKIEKIAKHALEMFDNGVMIFNKNMELVFVNKKAEIIFGYQANEMLGKSIDIFIPERFRVQHMMYMDEFANSGINVKRMNERTRKIYALHMNGHEFLTNITIMQSDVAGKYFIAIIKNDKISAGSDRELIRMAATDPLTGVLNKAEFMSIAEKETLRSKRYSRPFCVSLLKLDNLSEINDKYTYSIGDHALQWVSSICCNALRNVDIFGRWDESEFCILLPETEIEGATIIAARLVKLISDNSFEKDGNRINITVSVGIAEYDDSKTSLEGAMNNAGAALNIAINKGGNNVETYVER